MKYRRCWFDSNPTHWIGVAETGGDDLHLWPRCEKYARQVVALQVRVRIPSVTPTTNRASRRSFFRPRASRRSFHFSRARRGIRDGRPIARHWCRKPEIRVQLPAAPLLQSFSRWRIPMRSVRQWVTKDGVHRQATLKRLQLDRPRAGCPMRGPAALRVPAHLGRGGGASDETSPER